MPSVGPGRGGKPLTGSMAQWMDGWMQGRKEKEDYRKVAAVRIDLEKEKRETEDSKRVKGPLGFT